LLLTISVFRSDYVGLIFVSVGTRQCIDCSERTKLSCAPPSTFLNQVPTASLSWRHAISEAYDTVNLTPPQVRDCLASLNTSGGYQFTAMIVLKVYLKFCDDGSMVRRLVEAAHFCNETRGFTHVYTTNHVTCVLVFGAWSVQLALCACTLQGITCSGHSCHSCHSFHSRANPVLLRVPGSNAAGHLPQKCVADSEAL
jgi:hypothetical protein